MWKNLKKDARHIEFLNFSSAQGTTRLDHHLLPLMLLESEKEMSFIH